MESKKRNAIITVVVVIIVIMIAGFSAVQAVNATPPTVTTMTPARTDLTRAIVINGAVTAGETFETTLGFTQKVVAVNYKAGDLVRANDALVELDTADLQYQISKTEATIAQLTAGTAIAREQARLNLANAQLALAQARKNYTDALEKFDKKRITELVRDQASTALKTAENQVKLAQASFNSLDITSDSSDRKKQIDAANLDIANLRRKIADSSIRTPIAGTMTTLDARVGQMPTQQTAFIRVVDLENLKVEARVDQYDAVQLAVGQPAKISVKGLKGEFDGTIAEIGDVAAQLSGANAAAKYVVTITIDPLTMPTALKPGYEVDVRVILEVRRNAQSLPQTVIRTQTQNDERYVFAVRDGHAVRLTLQTGLEVDGQVEVLGGIEPGDQIVTSSSRELKDGEEVKLPAA